MFKWGELGILLRGCAHLHGQCVRQVIRCHSIFSQPSNHCYEFSVGGIVLLFSFNISQGCFTPWGCHYSRVECHLLTHVQRFISVTGKVLLPVSAPPDVLQNLEEMVSFSYSRFLLEKESSQLDPTTLSLILLLRKPSQEGLSVFSLQTGKVKSSQILVITTETSDLVIPRTSSATEGQYETL